MRCSGFVFGGENSLQRCPDVAIISPVMMKEVLKIFNRLGDNKAPGLHGDKTLKLTFKLKLVQYVNLSEIFLVDRIYSEVQECQRLVFLRLGSLLVNHPSVDLCICLFDTIGTQCWSE